MQEEAEREEEIKGGGGGGYNVSVKSASNMHPLLLPTCPLSIVHNLHVARKRRWGDHKGHCCVAAPNLPTCKIEANDISKRIK